MQATVRLDEFMRNEKLRKGMGLTYVHWDTGFPAPVTFVRKCKNPKKIRVERDAINKYDSPCLWTVDISACHVQITI